MARGSLNKVMLIGRLGRDPELRYTPNGATVCNFSIATDESYKDSNGQMQDRTEWHNIVIWRKLGEIAGQYLKKGSLVYIEGKLQTRSWEQDGQKRYTTEVIATDMTMLGGKGESGGANMDMNQARPESSQSFNQSTPEKQPDMSLPEDDDLPF